MTFSWSQDSDFVTQNWSTGPFETMDNHADNHVVVISGDFNGDGRMDVASTRSHWHRLAARYPRA